MSSDKPSPEASEPITVMVTYDPTTGNLQIQGPLHNRTITYGILVSAMEAVLKNGMRGEQELDGGRIVVPRGIFGGGRGT